MDIDAEKIHAGYLRKKGSRVNNWGERYFVLRGHTLFYYLKSTDTEPRGSVPLSATSSVSKIISDVNKKRMQFIFKLAWKDEDEKEETSGTPIKDNGDVKTAKREKKKSADDKHSASTGGKVAAATAGGVVVGSLTAGIGLLAGMLAVGMGASGSAAVATNNQGNEKERVMQLACDSYHEAEIWVSALETQIQSLNDHIFGFGISAPSSANVYRTRSLTYTPHKDVRLNEVHDWITNSKWKVYGIIEGVRILQQTHSSEDSVSFDDGFFKKSPKVSSISSLSEKGARLPCMRVNVAVNGSVSDTFFSIINTSPVLETGIIKSIRVVEAIDNFTDIIHIKLEPIYLPPTWTAPRDFCLIRYWRDNPGGSYLICMDSTTHSDCPLVPCYVRGELHCAYIVTPCKVKGHQLQHHKDTDDEDSGECLLSFIAQMDCKGWICNFGGFQGRFLQEFMLQALDIRDAMDSTRFLQVQFDPMAETKVPGAHGATTVVVEEQGTIASIPPPTLPPTMWVQSDASTFRVRGATYNTDKVKVNSGPSLFKLIAIDLFEVPEPTQNISSHPKNRVHLAHQRNENSWVFVVNIMVPGPPYLSFVVYMQGDKKLIEADTPFGRVAKPFFYGNDDEFRNNRFKLIPKIIDGNMIIKMAVKDTPTLLGNKLKQYYHKGENYFELDVDVGSSSVARNVVGLAMGYSKNIVVDMGFCLQGNEEDELPEVLMSGCTCIHVDASTAKKL